MSSTPLHRTLRPLALAVTLALGATAAQAATITVTDGGDAGTAATCTLRQAIVSANTDDATGSSCIAGSGADSIDFDASLANSTITLAGSELPVSADLTINGSGQTLDAAGASRVMSVSAGTLTASNLTFANGNASGDSGGGIYFATHVNLNLSHVTVRNNTASWGGGIYGWGHNVVNITASTISGNSATSTGGGLYFWTSTVTVNDSTISGNTAAGTGGGLWLLYDGSATVNNSTITGNTAAYGGGSYMGKGAGLAINDSTISGNTATVSGGGISVYQYDATLTMTNSIVAANTSPNAPDHDLAIGTGGDDAPYRPNPAGKSDGGNRPTAASTITPQWTLLGSALSATYPGNGNVFSDAPGLGALANNGGPTLTMALQPGSPAINAGNSGLVASGLNFDQRGSGFNRIVGSNVDMGAYEVQAGGGTIPDYVAVPVGSPWALGLLAGLLGFFGLRRRKTA